jgi:hypothetical protein
MLCVIMHLIVHYHSFSLQVMWMQVTHAVTMPGEGNEEEEAGNVVNEPDVAKNNKQYADALGAALARNKDPTTVHFESYCVEPAELEMLMEVFLYKDPKYTRKTTPTSSPTK